jgi:molecular chaperone DnaJ
MARDYYEILGVERNTDKEEIKRAYRRLARKYHPDVNKEAGADERFKEINRAYEVLSEPETRARYDRFGEGGVSSGGGGAPDMGDMGGFADIFESFFGGFSNTGQQQTRRRSGPTRGEDLRFDLKLEFREAVFGGEKQIKISHLETCGTCSGSGAKAGTRPRACGTCSGTGQVRRATRTPFGSFTQVSTCPTCNGTGEVQATILFAEEIENNLQYLLEDKKEAKLTLLVHPYLEAYFKKGILSRQMKWYMKYKKWVSVRAVVANQLLEYSFHNSDNEEIIF